MLTYILRAAAADCNAEMDEAEEFLRVVVSPAASERHHSRLRVHVPARHSTRASCKTLPETIFPGCEEF